MINKCINGKQLLLLFLCFLSDIEGYGKSPWVKAMLHSVCKVFLYQSWNPGKPRVLVAASTGGAAISIDGKTIHSG